MRHTIFTVIFLVVLANLAAVASAQEHRCSNPGLVGAWAYTETGTVVVPTANGPIEVMAVAVGRYDFDAGGTFSGTQYSSAGGAVSQDVKRGTYSVNDDCIGTVTLEVYDATGTTLRRSSVWEIVLDDNATEFRGIMSSMTLPNGVALSPIMAVSGRRLFRDSGVPNREWPPE